MSEIRTYIFDVGDTDSELPFNTQLVALADHEAAIEAEYNLRLKNVAQLSDVNTQLKAEVERLKNWIKANAEHTDRCVAVSGDCGGDCICYIRDLLKGGGSG